MNELLWDFIKTFLGFLISIPILEDIGLAFKMCIVFTLFYYLLGRIRYITEMIIRSKKEKIIYV